MFRGVLGVKAGGEFIGLGVGRLVFLLFSGGVGLFFSVMLPARPQGGAVGPTPVSCIHKRRTNVIAIATSSCACLRNVNPRPAKHERGTACGVACCFATLL